MAKYVGGHGPSVAELQQFYDEMRAGKWVMKSIDQAHDSMQDFVRISCELMECPPGTQVSLHPVEHNFCNALSQAIDELNGIAPPPGVIYGHIGIGHWQENVVSHGTIYTFGRNKGKNIVNRELFVELLCVPAMTRAQYHLVSHPRQQGKSLSKASISFNAAVQDMLIQLGGAALSSKQMQAMLDLHKPEPLEDSGMITEPFVGYRDFEIGREGSNIWLESRNGEEWHECQKHIALCMNAKDPLFGHDAPNEHCDCGIYAFDTPDHHDLRVDGNVWGEVYLWGDVLVCESGYRAQYAYPKNIFIRDPGTQTARWVRDELEKMYRVPVMLVQKRTGESMAQMMEASLQALIKDQFESA